MTTSRPIAWMSPARARALAATLTLLVPTLTSPRAQAQDAPVQRVWVMDLQADDAGLETGQHLAALLREELASALLDHRIGGVSGGCQDPDLASCARWLGAPDDTTLVVGGRLQQDVEGLDVELRVVDVPASGPQRSVQQRLPQSPATWRQTMRELGVRAVAPTRHTGSVEVQGLQVFDRITVDGMVVAHDVPLTRIELPVGPHSVEVMRTGLGVFSEVVEVRFEQTARPALGLAGAANDGATEPSDAAGASGTSPWLALGLAGGGAALVAVATGLALHGLIALQPELNYAQHMVDGGSICPDGSDCWGARAADIGGQLAVEMAGAGIAGLLGLGLVATAAVLVVGTEQVVGEDGEPAPTAP